MFRLDKKRWVYWFAFISIFLISGSVLAASWYSTLSQSFASTGSASTVHTFTLPSNQKVASGGYIKIELTGDFDAADEYADLYIEGTYIGKATGGSATCGANVTKNFTLSQANLEKWGADGKIVVTVKNSSAVSGCADTQRKHGLALSVTNLVSSQPVKTLSKVRINCTTPIVEGLTGTCSAFADFSDNSTQTVTSSITNWKADRAASISTSGVITALPVSADTFVTITGNYTYNGVTMTGIGSTTVKDDSISGLREFRISCPTSFNENTSIQCRSYAKIDGAEREVTTSSTWSENASYTSITPTGGLLTAVDVIGDSGVFVKASYSYGGVTKAAEQVVTVKDIPVLPTALTITCPSSIDESSTANCTAKVTLSNGSTSDVTSSSNWVSSSAFATVDTNGKITTQAVTADQHININASYTASSVTKTATAALTVKDVPTTTGKAVNIKNRFKGSLITFNSNTEWLITAVAGANTICEKSRPTYCLNVASGSLQSSVISNTSTYAQWSIESYDGYKRIRNIGYSTYYIHHESIDIMAGNIQLGWWSAQWILEEVSSNTVKSLSFTSKSNSSIQLTVGGNSEWVLTKDTIYGTNAYKICEKNRPDYCLNIEYNDTLQNSQIQYGWYSALWDIKQFSDGSFFIRSEWKRDKYIIINDSGATLTTNKFLNISTLSKIKSLLSSIPSLFISTASADENTDLHFGDALTEFLKNFNDKELWTLESPIEIWVKLPNGNIGINNTDLGHSMIYIGGSLYGFNQINNLSVLQKETPIDRISYYNRVEGYGAVIIKFEINISDVQKNRIIEHLEYWVAHQESLPEYNLLTFNCTSYLVKELLSGSNGDDTKKDMPNLDLSYTFKSPSSPIEMGGALYSNKYTTKIQGMYISDTYQYFTPYLNSDDFLAFIGRIKRERDLAFPNYPK